MSPLSQLLVEVAICLVASTLVTGFLTRPLRRLLAGACGTEERARFWVVYGDVMLFIAPLVAVVVFGRSGDPYAAPIVFYKAAAGSALAGIFVALAAVGLQVARTLPPRGEGRPAPAAPTAHPPFT